MITNLNTNTGRTGKRQPGFLGVMKWTRILAGIALLIVAQENQVQAAQAGQTASLSWQPSPDTNAVGYNLYYGTASHYYTNIVRVGNVSVVTIGGLVNGTTYYFAATASDAQGQESGFSNEASYLVPAQTSTNFLATVQIRSAPAGQFRLTITGPVNQSYAVEATEDFLIWTVIGTVVVGAGGSLDFVDVNAASLPQRFYRTREIP